jgi:hypothetical protein
MIGHKQGQEKGARLNMRSDGGKDQNRDPVQAGSRRITIGTRRSYVSGLVGIEDRTNDA